MLSTKLKMAAGVLGLGGLLLATPYVEGSSSILNYDNHCLRILERKQTDSVRNYLGRGTLSDFYFDVDGIEKTFRTNLRVYKYVGRENNVVKSKIVAKQYCPWILNNYNLVEFISADENSLSKECEYDLYRPKSSLSYMSPGEYAKDMYISCSIDVETPACTMDIFTESYWTMWINIEKVNLSDWRAVYTAAHAAIKARLEPLDYCPIEVPFL